MLTLTQSNDYTRHKTLAGFFATPANATIIGTFQPFQLQVKDHANNLSSLEAIIPNKDVITAGITNNKTLLKKKIADALVLVCGKTRAYALLNNHPELAEAMKTRADLVMKMKDADILPLVQRMNGLITPCFADTLFAPYGISATQLGSLMNDATAFKNSIGVADTSSSTSTIANSNINDLFKKLSGNLDMFDLLIHHFQTSNPDFVKGYGINVSLSNIGIHHTGIQGVVGHFTVIDPHVSF